MRRWLVAILLLASFASPAAPPRLASITLENDFMFGHDRHYTNGMQAAFLVDGEDLPRALRSLPPLSWNADPQVVMALGQRIYTPDDLSVAVPEENDRPYAGWLYLMADIRTRSAGRVMDHFLVSLGVVGPASGARQTQRFLHNLNGARRPMGWDTQLRDEPTILLGYERAWRGVLEGNLGAGVRYDVSLRAGGALGNVLTYANAGAVLRIGQHLPSDLPVTHVSLGPPRDGYRGAPQFGWYAWVGVDGRGVARNMFLDGNTFEDGHSVRRKPWGHDVQVGTALVWPTTRIGFTLIERSREFEGQAGSDRFGQLAVSFAY
ncbi:MAG TPA: lipid A deacylase LpxR family protein [Usitatibacter sp.]|nr:lipid A deacylase LpxR family protein [Usitatibacter sp.]